jgi:4-amino-4-deoxy-L-arabinose transferase and related glycosyltransferases of PMT family
LYAIVSYCVFWVLSLFGLTELNSQMYFVRLFLALFSLLTVYFGYKIVKYETKNTNSANAVGWLLALYWFFPWLAVRNLVEVVCVPFLLWGLWLYICSKESKKPLLLICYSALIMSIGMGIRLQAVFFVGGFGLALLIKKEWKQAIVFALTFCVGFFATQVTDLVMWHRPFAEMAEYVRYNLASSGAYPNAPWYQYFIVLFGLLLPPFSILLLVGFFYEWKRLYLFLPTFAFFFFHSIFPNKQERFILTIVPMVIILGMIAIWDWGNKYEYKKGLMKTIKVCFVVSCVINFIFLVPVCVHYSKRARVESMVYLSHQTNVNAFAIENTNTDNVTLAPRTYINYDAKVYYISNETKEVWDSAISVRPQYIIFEGEKNLALRVAKMKIKYPLLEYKTTKTASFIDRLLQKMNPRHIKNNDMFIYKTNVSK